MFEQLGICDRAKGRALRASRGQTATHLWDFLRLREEADIKLCALPPQHSSQALWVGIARHPLGLLCGNGQFPFSHDNGAL